MNKGIIIVLVIAAVFALSYPFFKSELVTLQSYSLDEIAFNSPEEGEDNLSLNSTDRMDELEQRMVKTRTTQDDNQEPAIVNADSSDLNLQRDDENLVVQTDGQVIDATGGAMIFEEEGDPYTGPYRATTTFIDNSPVGMRYSTDTIAVDYETGTSIRQSSRINID